MSRSRKGYKSPRLLKNPKRQRYYLLTIGLTILPGMFVGSMIAKYLAHFLDTTGLFSPEELDDYED
ncbi:uncharacterized protein Dvir_GJ26318 [Drosophila virilis]|uniref:Essential MCU regulator, mitochondrial n=1 Tax=Drosophila virilis TaxID=7244 RepID=A0A0Q9W8T9_DROVI|nr:uncharacterized protein Dvir_GJ26318 [Drosophila virilis]